MYKRLITCVRIVHNVNNLNHHNMNSTNSPVGNCIITLALLCFDSVVFYLGGCFLCFTCFRNNKGTRNEKTFEVVAVLFFMSSRLDPIGDQNDVRS